MDPLAEIERRIDNHKKFLGSNEPRHLLRAMEGIRDDVIKPYVEKVKELRAAAAHAVDYGLTGALTPVPDKESCYVTNKAVWRIRASLDRLKEDD